MKYSFACKEKSLLKILNDLTYIVIFSRIRVSSIIKTYVWPEKSMKNKETFSSRKTFCKYLEINRNTMKLYSLTRIIKENVYLRQTFY